MKPGMSIAVLFCTILLLNCGGGGGASSSSSSSSSPVTSTTSVPDSSAPPTDPSLTPLTETPTPNDTQLTCEDRIPSEQPENGWHEKIYYPTPPVGYGAVLGWANVTIGALGGTDGKVTVRNMALWEEYNGQITRIAIKITCPDCDINNKVWGYTVEKSLWGVKSAWENKSNEGMEFQVLSDTSLVVPASNRPSKVYHFWHTESELDPDMEEEWGRSPAKQGARYYITAEALIEGNAMIQIGIDYWEGMKSGGNIEAMFSNWYCSTSSWQTVKVGE